MSYVQLSEAGFQIVYPLGLWSRFSAVVKVLFGFGRLSPACQVLCPCVVAPPADRVQF